MWCSAAAGFPATIKLSTLDGSNGFRLDGRHARDYSGVRLPAPVMSMATAFADLIVGAEFADPNGDTGSGSSYVVFGKAAGFPATIKLSTLDAATVFGSMACTLLIIAAIRLPAPAMSMATALPDLIVGAWGADPYGSYSDRAMWCSAERRKCLLMQSARGADRACNQQRRIGNVKNEGPEFCRNACRDMARDVHP